MADADSGVIGRHNGFTDAIAGAIIL
jgi:hypothetical protein